MLNQLFRSFRKSRAMAKATKVELSTHDDEKLSKSRKKLYKFLINDKILSSGISEFDFPRFNSAISQLKAMGVTFSSTGDYLPIATFCFGLPLSAAIGYFIAEDLTWDEYFDILTQYFGKLL